MKSNENQEKDLLRRFSHHQLELIERAFFLGVMRRTRKKIAPTSKSHPKQISSVDIRDLDNKYIYSNLSYQNCLCQQLLEYGIEVDFGNRDDID